MDDLFVAEWLEWHFGRPDGPGQNSKPCMLSCINYTPMSSLYTVKKDKETKLLEEIPLHDAK